MSSLPPTRLSALALFAVLVAGAGLRAQSNPPLPSSELKPNPISALRAFEPAANQPYELGAGDEISIDFGGRPDLNVKRIIGPDGRITLPLAGAIAITDQTREQAAATIVAALTPFYNHLTATVGVDRYTSNRVLLLGAINRPGIVTFEQPPTLLEVLTRGGGLSEGEQAGGNYGSGGGGGGAGFSNGNVAHSNITLPDRLAIYRGQGQGQQQVMWVDLKGLLDSGSPLADLRLKRNDIVYIPSPRERYISILGQIQHPGALILDSNTTLAKLIAEAGGLTLQAGNYPDIRIVQPATGATRIINFKQVLNPGPLDLTLHSGDVIYVPESGFNKFTYSVERLSPLVTSFTAAALFTNN